MFPLIEVSCLELSTSLHSFWKSDIVPGPQTTSSVSSAATGKTWALVLVILNFWYSLSVLSPLRLPTLCSRSGLCLESSSPSSERFLSLQIRVSCYWSLPAGCPHSLPLDWVLRVRAQSCAPSYSAETALWELSEVYFKHKFIMGSFTTWLFSWGRTGLCLISVFLTVGCGPVC